MEEQGRRRNETTDAVGSAPPECIIYSLCLASSLHGNTTFRFAASLVCVHGGFNATHCTSPSHTRHNPGFVVLFFGGVGWCGLFWVFFFFWSGSILISVRNTKIQYSLSSTLKANPTPCTSL